MKPARERTLHNALMRGQGPKSMRTSASNPLKARTLSTIRKTSIETTRSTAGSILAAVSLLCPAKTAISASGKAPRRFFIAPDMSTVSPIAAVWSTAMRPTTPGIARLRRSAPRTGSRGTPRRRSTSRVSDSPRRFFTPRDSSSPRRHPAYTARRYQSSSSGVIWASNLLRSKRLTVP